MQACHKHPSEALILLHKVQNPSSPRIQAFSLLHISMASWALDIVLAQAQLLGAEQLNHRLSHPASQLAQLLSLLQKAGSDLVLQLVLLLQQVMPLVLH